MTYRQISPNTFLPTNFPKNFPMKIKVRQAESNWFVLEGCADPRAIAIVLSDFDVLLYLLLLKVIPETWSIYLVGYRK